MASRQPAGCRRYSFVRGHRNQDSANQLNPAFACALEMNHNAGGDADIVLHNVEEVTVEIVGLKPPGD